MSENLEAYDVAKIFSPDCIKFEIPDDVPVEQLVQKCSFPDFGAHLLQPVALTHICDDLGTQIHQALSAVSHMPSVAVARRMSSVWKKVVNAVSFELYSNASMEHAMKAAQKEDELGVSGRVEPSQDVSRAFSSSSKSDVPKAKESEEKQTGNTLLMEVGIKTGLTVVFSLLRHAWSQITWQKQLEQALSQSSSLSIGPAPTNNLPNDILRSVLDIIKGIPPMSLSNQKTLSQFSLGCLDQSNEFLQWVVSPSSLVDAEGKRLAMQIMISLYLQRGSLVHFLEWVETVLLLLSNYGKMDVGVSAPAPLPPTLEVGFCRGVLDEVKTRTVRVVPYITILQPLGTRWANLWGTLSHFVHQVACYDLTLCSTS